MQEVAQNATAVGKVLGKRLRNVDSSSQRGEPSRPSSGIAATSKHAGDIPRHDIHPRHECSPRAHS